MNRQNASQYPTCHQTQLCGVRALLITLSLSAIPSTHTQSKGISETEPTEVQIRAGWEIDSRHRNTVKICTDRP